MQHFYNKYIDVLYLPSMAMASYLPKWVKIKQVGEFKQIQEILSKIGTEIFKIDEEMTEKNETEDGNSISLKSPWHMK